MAIVTRAIHPNEPDLLIGKEHHALIFTDLDNNHLCTIQAPDEGWTHAALEKAGTEVRDEIQQMGWDAYLKSARSENWIGSSEV